MLFSWIGHEEAALIRPTTRGNSCEQAKFVSVNTYLWFSDIFFQVSEIAGALTVMRSPMTKLLQVTWNLLTF